MNLFEFANEGVRVLLNLKETSVSLSVADREVYAFDIEGKPLSFWMNGKTFVWTVDDAAVAKQLADAGVDGITTNRPQWLREQLKQTAP